MKLLWLHGGASNKKLSAMQYANVLSAMEGWKDNIIVETWEGPIKVGLDWLGPDDGNPMTESLKPFGPDYFIYYEHDTPETLGERFGVMTQHWQKEDHLQIEETLDKFAAYLKDNGPYDGWFGFDMGGHTLLRAATLAQEGDPRFAGMTRFVMLFTSITTRLLSPIAHVRPKTPLKIPALISWDGNDPVMPFICYEETALYFDEEVREVVVHGSGHQPPKLDSKTVPELAPRVQRFLKDMLAGSKPRVETGVSNNADYQGLWLPLTRVPAPSPPPGARKRLLVVPDLHSLEDLKKWHESPPADPPWCRDAGWQTVAKVHQNLWSKVLDLKASDFGEGSDIVIEEMAYTEEDKKNVLLDAPPNFSVYTQDFFTSAKLGRVKEIVSRFLAGFSKGEDFLGIVGVGSGAIVALMIARALVVEQRFVPGGFWAVCPPTVLPRDLLDKPGMLVDCPVTYMVHELSRVGPPWRWELMTLGPFQQQLYKDKGDLAKLVMDGFASL